MTENFLEHFGVKGMKWGVRKKPGSSKKKSAATIAKTLTNKELKKRVDRLNMEKRYSELVKESNRARMSNGKRIVNDVLENFGNTYPKSFGKKAAQRGSALAVDILGDVIEKKAKKARG